jgi:hypothetical protein
MVGASTACLDPLLSKRRGGKVATPSILRAISPLRNWSIGKILLAERQGGVVAEKNLSVASRMPQEISSRVHQLLGRRPEKQKGKILWQKLNWLNFKTNRGLTCS